MNSIKTYLSLKNQTVQETVNTQLSDLYLMKSKSNGRMTKIALNVKEKMQNEKRSKKIL